MLKTYQHYPGLAKYNDKLLAGRYRLEAPIGSGSAGVVYRATQVSVDRPVAVKLLHHSRHDDQISLARFELEAKALARIHHPGCVTLFDYGQDEELGIYYMVMEYVEGLDLERALLEERLPLPRLLEVLAQVCIALDVAHQEGIAHRDLKPSNIMIPKGKSTAKILDFGLAKLFQESRQVKISVAGHVYGTPAYMSPEQCHGKDDVGPPADIYALGVILYEAIESRFPYEISSTASMLLSHINEPIPPLQNTQASNAIESLIVQMTHKDPKQRLCDLVYISQEILKESTRLQLDGAPPSSTLLSWPTVEPPRLKDNIKDTNPEIPLPQIDLASQKKPPLPKVTKTTEVTTKDTVEETKDTQDDTPALLAPPHLDSSRRHMMIVLGILFFLVVVAASGVWIAQAPHTPDPLNYPKATLFPLKTKAPPSPAMQDVFLIPEAQPPSTSVKRPKKRKSPSIPKPQADPSRAKTLPF